MSERKVIATTGVYKELLDYQMDYDGDYMRMDVTIRTVSNTFDNTRVISFPDSYGEFVQGMTGNELVECRDKLVKEVNDFLFEQGFKTNVKHDIKVNL